MAVSKSRKVSRKKPSKPLKRLRRNPQKSQRRRSYKRLGMKMRAHGGGTEMLIISDAEFRTLRQSRVVEIFAEHGLENIIRGMATTSNTHGRVIAENNRRQTVLEHTVNLIISHLGSGVSLRTDWLENKEHVRVLRMAAFFHDSGKISLNGSGRPVSAGHDELSVKYINDHRNVLLNHFSEEQISQMIYLVEYKDVFFGKRVNIESIMRASEEMPGISSPETAMRMLLVLWIADSSTLPFEVWYREVYGRYPLREVFIFMAENIHKMSFTNIMEFCSMVNGPAHEIPENFYV